jgi:catalase
MFAPKLPSGDPMSQPQDSNAHPEHPSATTTDSGIPAASDEFSLTVGPSGPTVLHDHYLVQKMQQDGTRVAHGAGFVQRFGLTMHPRENNARIS